MTAVLKNIALKYPDAVPVLNGAPEVLVGLRELRTKYETNREIKTWAAWFLLKSLTRSCKIQKWRKQLDHLLPWLQLNERTLYRRLDEMERIGLVSFNETGEDINLVSYQKAADILGITFHGTTAVQYNPSTYEGKQTFQYFLRAEECRTAQERQLSALWYHLHKNENIPLFSHLCFYLERMGADKKRLAEDPGYFQERLLQLQLASFKESSEILDAVFTRRADINRGVRAMKRDHCYKSESCVTYMKRRMNELGIIQVSKKRVESKGRSRLYVPDGNSRRDGYKYNRTTQKTVLILTDQITFLYESLREKTGEKKASSAAA